MFSEGFFQMFPRKYPQEISDSLRIYPEVSLRIPPTVPTETTTAALLRISPKDPKRVLPEISLQSSQEVSVQIPPENLPKIHAKILRSSIKNHSRFVLENLPPVLLETLKEVSKNSPRSSAASFSNKSPGNFFKNSSGLFQDFAL